jgi:hypothetical protein
LRRTFGIFALGFAVELVHRQKMLERLGVPTRDLERDAHEVMRIDSQDLLVEGMRQKLDGSLVLRDIDADPPNSQIVGGVWIGRLGDRPQAATGPRRCFVHRLSRRDAGLGAQQPNIDALVGVGDQLLCLVAKTQRLIEIPP